RVAAMRTPNKKPIPGSSGDGFLVCRRTVFKSRETKLTVSPLRHDVRHHQRRALLTTWCDILRASITGGCSQGQARLVIRAPECVPMAPVGSPPPGSAM